jgi:myo-inositol-1(or 4)-monophosphatase
MFAASIGVVHRGLPVAGAVWCSISHALRAGVYHASAGGKLRFQGDDVTRKINAAVLRRLAGVPIAADADEAGWETRKTGPAALECALVAARASGGGALRRPNIWDVAGGIALVQAGGGEVREHNGQRWSPMRQFAPVPLKGQAADLRYWRRPVVVGTRKRVQTICSGTATRHRQA